ncbi:TPR repeat [Altererythrobacter epoxidivorans]|uniref:TPR repeat n=1 Tax=Altererythrobacter epoxidivorans TaxID=361183 RepID=A0A0M3TAV1_9SPHN|nr:YaiO family outer membrane beta-barrel protein [Altererythrobacter epoxidivorans]ALE17386.1 TPR repeat [Altererythrobacter epoxidivorans]
MTAALPAVAQGSTYDRAVAARLSGDAALSVDLLEPWLEEHPEDVDARVQYGYALLALGRFDEAESAFSRVLVTAPEYEDATKGRSLVAERRARGSATRSGFILLEGAMSELEGGQSDWKEAGAVLAVPTGERDMLDIRAHWYERFSVEDVELGALLTHRAGENVWLRVGGSITPSADFRPEIGLTAGIDTRLGPSTVLSLDGAWQRFPAQDVWSLRPGITQYLGGGRFAISATANAVAADSDDLLFGASLWADYLPRERERLFFGIASGPETDLGEVRDTTSLFGGGEIPVTQDISLIGSLAHEWRETGSDRTEGRMGIKFSL